MGRGKSRARGVRAKSDAIRRRRAMDVDASNAARAAVRRVVCRTAFHTISLNALCMLTLLRYIMFFDLQYVMCLCAWAYVRCILSTCGHFSRIESFVCLSLERLFVSLETRDLKAFERRRARQITPRERWGRWARTHEGDACDSARAALVRVRRRWRARRRRASVRWSRSRCCGVGHPSALERTTGRRARVCAPRMCACFLPHRSSV